MLLEEYIKKRINENLELARKILDYNKKKYSIIGSKEDAYAVIITVINILFGFSNNKILKRELITDGQKDGGVDAIVINDRKKEIDIFDIKESNKFERQSIINHFAEELKMNFFNPNTSLTNLNSLAAKKIREAREKFHKQDYKIHICIVRCLNKKNKNQKLKENLKARFKNCRSKYLELKLFNLRDLVEIDIKHLKKVNFSHRIIFEQESSFYDENNNIVVGKVLLIHLLDIFKKAHDQQYNIFEDNIRVNQNDKSLEYSFKNTISEQKDKFYLFHNGITISCKNLEKISSPHSFNITSPQIINGCQSLSILFKMYQDKKILEDDCKKIMILTRFFQAKDENEINSICQSTNTQRKIEKWDLRTNDFVQKILEKVLNLEGYSYLRKKKPGVKDKILITDLGQWIYSCKYKKPAKAKSSKKDLFDILNGDKSIYKKIFNEKELKINEIKKICDYCIFVQKEIKKKNEELKGKDNKDKRSFLDHANFHIMAFLYNYGVKKEKSFEKAIKFCRKAVKKMRKERGKEYSYNNVFKNETTWKIIEKLIEE